MAAITLYQFAGEHGFSISPFCNKVHFALRLKGLAYRTIDVLIARRVSTTGKLPVLLYDGEAVHDSSDVLTYLEARHPEPATVPHDTRRAAEARVLEEWADEALVRLVGYFVWRGPDAIARFGQILLPTVPAIASRAVMRVEQRKQLAKAADLAARGVHVVDGALESYLDVLCALLAGREWLVGDDAPSIADIAVAAQLERFTIVPNRDALARIRARPALDAWLARFRARVAASAAR
jgi:glutathione S-transferase